jgi:hypothetical protein
MHTHARSGSLATTLANGSLEQISEKNISQYQPLARGKTGKNRDSKKSRLRWEAVNDVTWRLIDPDGPQILVPRSHGQWPAFKTPTALAWVFNTGIEWEVRIRLNKRGGGFGGWRAVGCDGDLKLAKQVAQAEVEP